MLGPQKKRHRRKKKNETQQHLLAIKPAVAPLPLRLQSKAKLKATYVQEELDVKESLSSRQQTNEPSSLVIQQQREIDFFTDAVVVDDNDDQSANSSLADDAAHNIISSAKPPRGTPISSPGAKTTDDGPQLTSSYIQLDDVITENWTKSKVLYDRLHLPSWTAAPISDAENAPSEPVRNLADEGLFVWPAPAQLSKRNKTMTINRCLASSPTWTQLNHTSTELLHLRDYTTSRDLVKSVSTKKFVPLHFAPLAVGQILANDSLSRSVVERILNIHIGEMYIAASGSQQNEQAIAEQIEATYQQYLNRLENRGATEHLRQKLTIVRHLLSQTDGNESDAQKPRLIADRRDTRRALHRELQADRELLQRLLENWKSLKDVRQQQGSNKTALKLVIKTEATDEAADRREWDEKFSLEIGECLEEALDGYHTAKQTGERVKRPNANEIEDDLHGTYVKALRHPGEPKLYLELHKSATGTGTSKHIQANSIKYRIQIKIDGNVAATAKSAQLSYASPNRVPFNAKFAVQPTTGGPKTLQLMIHEEKRLGHERTLVELFLPVPESHELFESVSATPMTFTSCSTKRSGCIDLKIGWSTAAPTCEMASNCLPMRTSRLPIADNLATVQQWFDDELLDPMDPDATSLNQLMLNKNSLRPVPLDVPSTSKLFRLNEDRTAFCSADVILQDKRLNLLADRFKANLKFKNRKFVPNTEREVLECDGTDDDDGGALQCIEDLDWMDPIDLQRHRGKKYLRNMYRTLTNYCDTLGRSSDAQSLLIGDEIPTIGSIIAAVRQLFGPKRPLNPQRRLESSYAAANRAVTFKSPDKIRNMRLIVYVIRAHGVPFRKVLVTAPASSRRTSTISSVFLPRSSVVTPYVVASFRNKSGRTTTAEGSNPTWNEQITLPVSDIGDLNRNTDWLCLNLFDEHVEDLLDDDLARSNEAYQRISSKWLGEMRIPFYTIMTSQRIEGTFELSTPPLLLGYERPSISTPDGSTFLENTPELRSSVYLTLFVTVEPRVACGTLNTAHLECTELSAVTERIQLWSAEFREEFPQRFRDPLITLPNGKRVCITRLVGAIDIPFERSSVAEFLIRRFVSMIPVLQSSDACSDLNGVWLNNEQILSILSTSAKDHGTLLASYYLSLGFRAYLVMGHALPYGDTTFVLTKENAEYFLIDPNTGRKYAATDTYCPLTRVYCVVGHDNVWANIQREHRVFMMQFDVKRTAEWRPLFGKSCMAPTGTVHDLALDYKNSDHIFELKKAIEWKVMKKISSWRTHRRTTWNRNVSVAMQQILVELEEDVCYEYDRKSYSDKLTNVMAVYKVSGFPLNMRYVSLSSIVERVRGTRIHVNNDSKVEFAVAVHIQPYPNNVLSVWIFLLSLVPKV